MRFVTVKREAKQAPSAVFRTRDFLVGQHTQLIDALRGRLSEYGVVARVGNHHVERLIDEVADPASSVPAEVRSCLQLMIESGKGYVLGVTGKHHFHGWGKARVGGTAEEIASGLQASQWVRLSAGEGSKRPRLQDWAYVELAEIDAEGFYEGASGTWTRGLMIHRNIADSDVAFFTT